MWCKLICTSLSFIISDFVNEIDSDLKSFSNDGRDSVQRYEIIYLIPSPPPPLCSFSKELQATVRLLAPKCDITFLVSEDGSGKGAAMVTAVAQRLALQSRLLEDSDGEDEDEEEEEEEK